MILRFILGIFYFDAFALKKEYKNGELTIVWEPSKCVHAAVCVNTLPKVYDPKAKPWIAAENATIDELKSQINNCPSGALSFYMENEEKQIDQEEASETKITVNPNGPLRVHGRLEVTDKDGNIQIKENGASFCRCGASKNGPFCDGTHRNVDFER